MRTTLIVWFHASGWTIPQQPTGVGVVCTLDYIRAPGIMRTLWKKDKMNYLKQNWIEFIQNQDPNIFLTITFKQHYEMTDIQAFRLLNKLLHFVNAELYGRNYQQNDQFLPGIGCVEYQANQVPHFHLLITTDEPVNRTNDAFVKKITKFPQLSLRGFDFQEISEVENIAPYITKSITDTTQNKIFPLSKDGISHIR